MNSIFGRLSALFTVATFAFAQSQLTPSKPERAAVDGALSSVRRSAANLQPGRSRSAVKLEWREDGALRSASGFRSASYAGTPAEAAMSFFGDHRDLFPGLSPEMMMAVQSRSLGSRRYVRLQQRMSDGIPVRGAQLVVHLGTDQSVESFRSSLILNIVPEGEWVLEKDQAIERVRAASGMTPSDVPQAERIYVPRAGVAVPAWRIVFQSANPPGDWEVLVSATDGSVLETQNMRHGDRALGYAYPSNPVTGRVEQVSLENLTSDTYLSSRQTRVFSYLPALRGQVAPNTFVQTATRRSGNFLYGADDVRFPEVQLYYGMESANARFQGLGFSGFEFQLPGVVLYQEYDKEQKQFVGSDNAFFSPVRFEHGGMFFFLTSRQGDTSLDTDVIYHEYTHAVINDFVGPQQSDSFRALNEGTADYFSSSFLNDPVLAEYAAKLFNLRTGYLRRTDNQNTWPYNTVGEVHADGNIWSGALWDLRSKVGAKIADEIAINAVAVLSPTAEFFDAASAAIDAADELFGAKAAAVVESVMENRGIYTSAARTSSQAITMSQGKSVSGKISQASSGTLLLGAQQYRIVVPNRATKLTVRVQANTDVRFYIRYRVPITIENGQLMAEQRSATGTEIGGYLSLDNTPELQSGTYYIAIVNTTPVTATYLVAATIDGGDPTAMPAITFVENGGSASGSVPSGPFLASRQFAVEIPEGVTALSITLEGDHDVDLYVRFGKYVLINDAGFPEADLVSNSASSREDMRITTKQGGSLPSGVYAIGVYNYSSETSRFSVRARFE